ncbi:unnamed protein product [Trichobilharzia regenti]|nr:unnamed protein product [Trichobilharzia regenti]
MTKVCLKYFSPLCVYLIVNPTECFIDAFKRIDDDLCSVNFPNILFDGQTTTTTLLPFSSDESANNSLNTSLARDLMRVNLSGSVGIAGYLHWHDKLSNRPTELYLANTGDCGAVLLREVQSSSSSSSSSSNVEMDKGKGKINVYIIIVLQLRDDKVDSHLMNNPHFLNLFLSHDL